MLSRFAGISLMKKVKFSVEMTRDVRELLVKFEVKIRGFVGKG